QKKQIADGPLTYDFNLEVMTTEQAQKLGQQYDQLTEKIITKVDERKQKETERLRKLFADSYVLTSEEENKRLRLWLWLYL
ncbi:hypothetical protein ACUODJ_45785, partial [Escherichia sp. HC-CC]